MNNNMPQQAKPGMQGQFFQNPNANNFNPNLNTNSNPNINVVNNPAAARGGSQGFMNKPLQNNNFGGNNSNISSGNNSNNNSNNNFQ